MECNRRRVFDHRVLRIIFGVREWERQDLRSLHNQELDYFYSSPYFRVIKSRVRWVGHGARVGKKEKSMQDCEEES
jgi:hypothetical protein